VLNQQFATQIQIMQTGDINGVVSVHLASFQGFFLTFLGRRFLSELYHSIIMDPAGIAFVYKENTIHGFVAGTSQPAGFYRRLLRHRLLRFGWAALMPILNRPVIIPRLLRAINMPSQAEKGEKCGILMSIAVDPAYQGKGVGKKLVSAFLEETHRWGLEYVDLTTDAVNNKSANSFYQSIGFKLVRTFNTPEGRSMNEYLIPLSALY
jgi:GNAT superfamily N-acetyltransferase